MFFGLVAVDDHPCCKMQEVVEAFFLNSIVTGAFSLDLFPEWMRLTLRNPHCSLEEKFSKVHALLHDETMNEEARRGIYEQLQSTNRIEELCDGTVSPPEAAVTVLVVEPKEDLVMLIPLIPFGRCDLTHWG